MNSKKLVGILSSLVGIALFTIGLIYFIKSFYTYDGGFEADTDFVILMVVGLIYLVFGVYSIFKSNDEKYNLIKTSIIVLLASGAILGAFSFGGLFKSIAKGNGFIAYNFILGMVGIFILSFGLFIYYYNKMKKNNSDKAA